MLAVVQHDQDVLGGQRIEQRLEDGPAGCPAIPSASDMAGATAILVGDRGQLHQPDPVTGPVEQLGGHLQGQPGLADPPAPVSVTSREDSTRARTSASSRSRPMKSPAGPADCSPAPGCPASAAAGTRPAGPPRAAGRSCSGRPRSFSRWRPDPSAPRPAGASRAPAGPPSRQQHLPPMRHGRQPGGAMDIQAHKAGRPSPRPHRYGCPSAPGHAPRRARPAPPGPAASPAPPPRTPAARRTRRRTRLPGVRFPAAVGGQGRPDQRVVVGKHLRVGVLPEAPEQSRRALNVGKKKRVRLHQHQA